MANIETEVPEEEEEDEEIVEWQTYMGSTTEIRKKMMMSMFDVKVTLAVLAFFAYLISQTSMMLVDWYATTSLPYEMTLTSFTIVILVLLFSYYVYMIFPNSRSSLRDFLFFIGFSLALLFDFARLVIISPIYLSPGACAAVSWCDDQRALMGIFYYTYIVGIVLLYVVVLFTIFRYLITNVLKSFTFLVLTGGSLVAALTTMILVYSSSLAFFPNSFIMLAWLSYFPVLIMLSYAALIFFAAPTNAYQFSIALAFISGAIEFIVLVFYANIVFHETRCLTYDFCSMARDRFMVAFVSHCVTVLMILSMIVFEIVFVNPTRKIKVE